MLIALTRAVPDSMEQCELTHLQRMPIDMTRALAEHAHYEAVLRSLGVDVVRLPPLPDLPDSVFVEDTAIVLDECAIITRPGAASRRGETPSTRDALAQLRDVREMMAPATLDGGDVLRLGRQLFVGMSSRTNRPGIDQLSDLAGLFGYRVTPVDVAGVLHLKSAATAASDDVVVVNGTLVAPDAFGVRSITVPVDEPAGANVLAIDNTVLCAANAPRTAELLANAGFSVIAVDNSELAKAEAALTCCSLLVS
jgi:dimethylargininase